MVSLQNFCHYMMSIHARPVAHIHYMREAWVSPHDNSVRVTFDRAIQCEPEFSTELTTVTRNPGFAFGSVVVLELKFTISGQPQSFWNIGDEYLMDLRANYLPPDWFPEMIRIFGLIQCGAAKYVEGIYNYGEDAFVNHGHYSDLENITPSDLDVDGTWGYGPRNLSAVMGESND